MSGPASSTIRLKVITPRQLLADADVESVSLPSLEGEIGILPGHRPLFVGIGKGLVRFRAQGEEETLAVEGGYAQVQPDEVLVMTDVGENEDSGDVAG
jgi:F-type H+-transporting ATPase subunit epsilon